MPYVHINIREGRAPELVRALISSVTTAVVDTLGAAPPSVLVIVTEIPAAHWARGDVTLAEQSDAGQLLGSEARS